MKYIVQEPVLTTITDEDVTETSSIFDILKKLKESQQNFHISYEDSDTFFIRSLDCARITGLSEEKVDIHAFLNAATVKYKNISLGSIRKIRVISSKQDMIKKHKATRFQMMEVADLTEL